MAMQSILDMIPRQLLVPLLWLSLIAICATAIWLTSLVIRASFEEHPKE